MPSLKTQLLMDTEQYDAALVRSRAVAAVAGQDIQRKLSLKISAMREGISQMPPGAARMAAEEKLAAERMRLAVATQRSITALEIAEYERRGRAEAVLAKRNAYLASKAAIMGTTGSGMAPGFAKLLATEAKMATPAVDGLGNALSSVHGKIPGLNLVLRETLVIFREIGRGNWARVPGSFSLVLQGLRNMRAELGVFGALFTVTGALVVAAVGGIVASFFIWEHRVKSLTEALSGLARVDLPKPDISRLSAYEEGWKRIKAAIQEASDQITSVNAKFELMAKLLDQSQGTEKQLLEIRKATELEQAGDDPAKRAAIQAKYAREEHDLEKRQMEEQEKMQADKVAALQKEEDDKKAQADAIKVSTEADEKFQEEALKKQVEANTALQKDKHGKDIEGSSVLQQAQQTVDELTAKAKVHMVAPLTGDDLGEQGLGGDDQARLDAAKATLETGKRDQKKLDDFLLAKKDRDTLRQRQKQLYDEAAAAGGDKVKAQKALDDAKALNAQILADDDKLRAAQADEVNNNYSRRASMGNRAPLNADQRIGAYQAAQGISRQERLLEKIATNTDGLKPPPHPPVGKQKPTFGGVWE